MNNEQNPVEQSTSAEGSLAELSLADYRASREKPAETPKLAETPEDEDAHAGEQSLGETDAEEGDAAETEHEGSKPSDDKKPAKRGGWQRKLEKAEREIETLKQQLAKPASTATKEQPAPLSEAKTQAFDKAEPQIEDFDTVGEYTKALLGWDRERVKFDDAQQAATAQAQQEADSLLKEWKARVTDAKKAHSDYDSVMEKAKDVPVSPAHQRLFLDSEHGAEIAYDLASDAAGLKKFAEMPPLAAARYFGKLEMAYESETPKPETKVSNAPRPIRMVGGKASSTASVDVSKLSLSDYRRLRDSRKIA